MVVVADVVSLQESTCSADQRMIEERLERTRGGVARITSDGSSGERTMQDSCSKDPERLPRLQVRFCDSHERSEGTLFSLYENTEAP